MELAEISEMMSLVLERLSETERELKRIQKEGSLAKTNRVSEGGRLVRNVGLSGGGLYS